MIRIEQTADGSHTLFVPELNEHYHSIKGALTESEHIFIRTALRHCLRHDIQILEIGFGTGLNAFLTLLEAEKTQRKIYYTTIERYPLDIELVKKLHYPELISSAHAELFYKLHETEWDVPQAVTSHFTLLKIKGDFTHFTTEEKYDVVYYDAFAPEKQPEMWSQTLFDKLFNRMNPDGILTTYCAKGAVRRMLQTSGFHVERLQGPPGGKREILRATAAKLQADKNI